MRDILANTSAVFASVLNSQIGGECTSGCVCVCVLVCIVKKVHHIPSCPVLLTDTVDPVALDLLRAQSQNISKSFADVVDDVSLYHVTTVIISSSSSNESNVVLSFLLSLSLSLSPLMATSFSFP